MALVTINDTTLTNIADAIREKGGFETGIKPVDMASAIVNLPSGEPNLCGIVIEENGIYTPDEEFDGFFEVEVNVPSGGNATFPDLYVTLSAYGQVNKPSSGGALIIDTSEMSTLSFDCYLDQMVYSTGAYYTLAITPVTNQYRVINGTGTYIEVPNYSDSDYWIETLLNNTLPTKHTILSFSCDVSEYDKVCIYAYITPYSTSSGQNYSGYCKVYNVKGE